MMHVPEACQTKEELRLMLKHERDRYRAAIQLIEKLTGALEYMQASFEVLLTSAREECDLTDDGVANLINLSVASADEALAAVKEFEGK